MALTENICITRQPIVDNNRELYAHQLLFKDKMRNSNEVGLDKMVGESLTFLNCDYDFLLSETPHGLNPDVFILEVLPITLVDYKIIKTLKGLHAKGFKIALDDFELTQENSTLIAPIIPFLSFCKMEYPKHKDSDKFPKLMEIFHKHQIRVVMESVETISDFKHCHSLGADFFQGYFFAKSESAKSIEIKADTMGAMNILNMMSGNYLDLEINQLEAEFKRYPDLTVNLLKYLNSAHFGMRSGITSIKHALSLLGFSRLKRWLLVLAYDNPDVNLEKSPLLMNAMMRANFFINVGKKLNWQNERAEKAFLMGLISHLDAFYQTSIQNILSQISLDAEITNALLKGEGEMGVLLDLILIVEQGKDASELLSLLRLSQKDVNECLIAAYTSSLSLA
jgi:EAL and modified HD-GYP domain-containing signal transduction protein